MILKSGVGTLEDIIVPCYGGNIEISTKSGRF
jgi:hypothetical protein